MKSVSVIALAMASMAAAQNHGHGHAHGHQARQQHQHHHDHAKRVLETEIVVEWVTETITELIDATTTQWFTPSGNNPATTFATVTTPSAAAAVVSTPAAAASSNDAGQFAEAPSSTTTSTSASSTVVAEPSVAKATSTYVAPAETTTSAYVAPEPTTTSTPVAVVESTTSTSAAAAATSSESTTTSSSSDTNTGYKITWIGPTTGAYSSCGTLYEDGSMFVAVDPSVLPACAQGSTGTPMTITANGKTISAYAIDKCMGCDANHIDVATAVYEALGWDTTDGGMHDTGYIMWSID